MVYCGELCRTCKRHCDGIPEKYTLLEMECTGCDGAGWIGKEQCEQCKGHGKVILNECPREMLGSELASAINLAGFANRGHLPSNGGILDQDAWFMSAWSAFETDKNKIDEERRQRK